jgi:hypothetical protein
VQHQPLGSGLIAAPGLQEDQQGLAQPGVVLVSAARPASVPSTHGLSSSAVPSIMAIGAISPNVTARGADDPAASATAWSSPDDFPAEHYERSWTNRFQPYQLNQTGRRGLGLS